MGFSIQSRQAPGGSALDATIWILDDGNGGRAEIWPALGFNCFHWQAMNKGQALNLLYADPALFADGRPTRSGIPILFPFPNRIRGGRFAFAGKEYQLPLNDAPKQNAIHGFACRRPWRVVGQGTDGASAWITGEFHGDRDAPDCKSLWPADYRLRITYRLGANVLRLEAEVANPDTRPLPFGLGYHPYFHLPFARGTTAADCTVSVPARSFWELTDCLPTGERKPVDSSRDLNGPRRYGDLQLDDVLTDLPPVPSGKLRDCGTITGLPGTALRLLCSPTFREMVVFTPGHREAFCIEPYTCATDAANLQTRGSDAGWLTLAPGATWTSEFEMRI